MNQHQQALEFMKQHHIGVISTVAADGLPEAAVIEIATTDDFEIIFDTYTSYRKYTNIQHNPRVAFVIGWDNNITVQYEGTAAELSDNELEQKQRTYFTHNPEAKKWLAEPEIRFFKVTPAWLRYRDGNTDPMTIYELNLQS